MKKLLIAFALLISATLNAQVQYGGQIRSALATPVTVLQNAVAVTGNGTSFVSTGYGTTVMTVSGIFVATINFEFSPDAGTTWSPISATQIGAGDIFTQTTLPGTFRITCTGLDLLRARVTWTSGTVTVNAKGTNAVNASKVVKLASGTNLIGKFGIDQTTQGVTNAVSVTSQPEVVTTGTITTTDIVVPAPSGAGALLSGTPTAGSYVSALATGGNASVVIGITGLTTGTIYYEGSGDSNTGIDGNWVSLNMKQAGVINTQISSSTTTNGLFRGNTAGIRYIRMRSVGALTGTPTITLRLSAGVAGEFLFGSIPTGTNNIGSVKLPDIATAGSLAALNATVTTAVNSQGIVAIQLTGTWAGTITFQGTEDPTGIAAPSTSWFNVNGVASVTGLQVTSTTVNGQFRVNSGGYTAVRAIMPVFTSGSATVWANASIAPSMATLAEPLPTGANTIGAVNINGTIPVSGAFFQTTQPVSIAVNTPTLQAGSTTTVTQTTAANLNATIVGTVTANAGTGTMAVSLATNTPTLAAGTNIVGKVGIDQTTPGTTNLVSIGTSGTVAINAALPTGTNTIGAVNIAAAQTLANVTTVAAVTVITNALPTGTNTIGAIQTKGVAVNGSSLGFVNSAATTNATNLKTSGGTIYAITVMNTSAALRYVRIYNLAVVPTVGTSIPIIVIAIPATSSKEIQFSLGIAMSTGIAYSITGLAPVTDATVVAAGDVQLAISWN